MCNLSHCPFSDLLSPFSHLPNPTVDLHSLVTRRNHSNCPFSSRMIPSLLVCLCTYQTPLSTCILLKLGEITLIVPFRLLWPLLLKKKKPLSRRRKCQLHRGGSGRGHRFKAGNTNSLLQLSLSGPEHYVSVSPSVCHSHSDALARVRVPISNNMSFLFFYLSCFWSQVQV